MKKTKKKPNARGTKLLKIMRSYADDVISKEIPACKWTRFACKRFIKDFERQRTKDFPYYFDARAADVVWRFIELLSHIKGKWARKTPGQPAYSNNLKLEPFQIFIVGNIFGWKKVSDGKRRFRKASVYLPRKNAKSTLAAAIGHWMAWMDDEPGSEVYAGATTEKQALEVFTPARLMAKNDPRMTEALEIEVGSARLYRITDGSRFQPIIGKPGDGASPHLSITDEYHEHDTSDQYETMLTGMGAREQPLAFIISTAGDNLAGPCYDDWLTCKKILEGALEDDTTFCIIYTIDEKDDWTSLLALQKANPCMGISVGEEFLKLQQKDAIHNARKQGSFKTKHLNIWVQARNAFINMQKLAMCRRDIKLDDFRKKRCVIGLDLASKIDLAAMEILFDDDDGTFYRFGRYYLPRETVDLKENEHYQKWEREGWLTVTEGNITDYVKIKDDIIEFSSLFQLENVAYDPHQATMLVTELQTEGIPCIEVRPTVLNFSEPMKQIEALVKDEKLLHNGDPVFIWSCSNVVSKEDAKDNIYPRKERPEKKIDPFVALISCMALKTNIKKEPEKKFQMMFVGAGG